MNVPQKNFFNDQFLNKDFHEKIYIPNFNLPHGFKIFSLFYIADIFTFEDPYFLEIISFSNEKLIDFSLYLKKIVNYLNFNQDIFEIDFLKNFTDRSPTIFQDLINISFYKNNISIFIESKSSEIINSSLIHSNFYTFPHYFNIITNIENIPNSIKITSGQPIFFNSLIKNHFSTNLILKNNSNEIKNLINKFSNNNFELKWFIIREEFEISLILCSNPNFIKISDGKTILINNLFESLKNSIILFSCYQHSNFSKNILFLPYDNFEININIINSDYYYLNILTKYINLNNNIFDFIINSIQNPIIYFKESNYNDLICKSSTLLLESFHFNINKINFIEKILNSKIDYIQSQLAVLEFGRFTLWIRSLIKVMKYFINFNELKLIQSISSLIYSIPIKILNLKSLTIYILINIYQKFNKKNFKNNEIITNLLNSFKNLIGLDYLKILNLSYYQIPKNLRDGVITIDTCIETFLQYNFKKEILNYNIFNQKFKKYYNLFIKEIEFNCNNYLNINFHNEFILFIKTQTNKQFIQC